MPTVHLTARGMYNNLRIWGILFTVWPPDPKASRVRWIVQDIVYVGSILNSLFFIYGVAMWTWQNSDNMAHVMKSVSIVMALVDVISHQIVCRLKRSEMSSLLITIRTFLDTPHAHEREILQKYVDRYKLLFFVVESSYLMAAVAFASGPIFLPGVLPVQVSYNINMEGLLLYFMCALQVSSIFNTALSVCIDLTVGFFIWFPAARLEMLGVELENAKNEEDMKLCAKKYQEIIRLTEKTQVIVKYVLFMTNMTMTACVVSGCIPLIFDEPLALKLQFVYMSSGALMKLYVAAGPADNLREMSERICLSAYSSSWIGATSEMTSNVLGIMERSQKPIFISMGLFLPPISLTYYSNYLYTTFSYFMAVRTMLNKDK